MKENDIQGKIETIEQSTKYRLSKDYQALYWEQLIVVDCPRTRLAIDDISYKAKLPIDYDIEMLKLACNGWVEIYDARDLTASLEQKLKSLVRALNPRKTIVIFPGNGAQVVKELLGKNLFDGFPSTSVSTQRIIDTGTKTLLGVQVENKNAVRKILSEINPEIILVLDDAIATGATLTALQQAFSTRKTEWFAGSLMMLSPLQRRGNKNSNSGIDGYRTILSPIIYQGVSGTPPLNSLSTFVGDSEKSEIVRYNYMQEYADDKEAFQQAIEQIQRKMKGGL